MTNTPNTIRGLIGANWREGRGDHFTSVNPSHPDHVVGEGTLADTTDIDDAVRAASEAESGWSSTPHHGRAAVLGRAAAIVESNAEVWGVELAIEEGKTAPEGVGEVLRAAQVLRYCAGEADREAGEIFNSPRRGERILVARRPVGVVGVITPFNFPIAIPAWKIAPALSYGNTVVWKPAGTVPVLAMHLAEALREAGLPPGVLNLVPANGRDAQHLVDHPGIDAITFTGSTTVGRAIAASGAARGVPVQAEMGGKNPAVVLEDADLDLAIEQVMLGAFRSAGQKCTATSRLIVHQAVADDFLAELARRASSLVVGDAVADGTQMGPVVSAAARTDVQRGIDEAIAEGARPLAGGRAYAEGVIGDGYFVPPTVLELASERAAVWREELFGPVLCVRRATDAEDAFRLANDSAFGLSAAVFTRDLAKALDSIDHLDVGILHVNSETAGADPHVPFGGAKKSGLGPKEQGRASREFFTHTTTVYLRGNDPAS